MDTRQKNFKRLFDIFLSFIGIFLFWWLVILAWVIASIETKKNGFYLQDRIGRNGRIFRIIKIRTMLSNNNVSTVTVSGDSRITLSGKFFRKMKVDELPQLINVIVGHMSIVGPRPDVPGYADMLIGKKKIILSVRPGITGPATLKYRNEETLLSKQKNPEAYNKNIIWPDKVRINYDYVSKYSFAKDLYYIWRTIVK